MLYIKYPDSPEPEIYTITNEQLHVFVKNEDIEKYDREAVMMTFFYFDQKVFGEERTYINIPKELIEKVPAEEGLKYKYLSFKIESEDIDNDTGRIRDFCITYYHCTGEPVCQPTCDNCSPICQHTECYPLGDGSGHGGTPTGPTDPTDPEDGSVGGSQNGNNPFPWYTNIYTNYTSFSPKMKFLLENLYDFGYTLDEINEITTLESPKFRACVQKFNAYLSPNTLEKSRFIFDVILFVCSNKDNIVEPQNILQRIDALEQYLYDHPYAISDIPCDQIPQWQEVAQHQVPTSVKNKLQNLDNTHTSPYYGWALQNIENAKGSLVNNDYFSVTFNTMPYKPFPHNNEQFTAAEFLSYVRTNLNSFVNTNYSSFTPSNQTGYNEGAIWYSNNPIEAIIHINIPSQINNQYGDDGSVITSGYQINTNGMGSFSNSHWMFTTIKTPYASLTQGLDGEHPVSGHRKFGLIKSGDSYTIYTRGVDRVTGGLGATLVGQQYMFTQADNLWSSFQQGIKSYIQNNSYGNTITINTPAKWRPKWQEAKNVLINNLPPSTLDECN